jgi:hydroxypyruvate reductase
VVCLLWGGEPTVTVRGAGRGGRSQECALAAALTFEHLAAAGTSGADVVYLAGGTDGIDGPTRAAGAWVTPATARRARARGVDPAAALDANDAHGFFATLGALDGGGLLVTGPTHTNAMDVHVALVRRGDRP